MGARGPQPTPTRLKLLRGETRPSRLNRSEPRPREGTPEPPPDLAPEAVAVWRHVLREIGHAGVITALDADVLAVYCESVARYRAAARLLDASGPLITASGTGARRGELVKNPLHQVVRDNALLVRALARELGLTPAARVGLAGRGPEVVDPFEAFLRGDAGA